MGVVLSLSRWGTRLHLRAYGCRGDHGERKGKREIVIKGADFGAPDDGGQCEGGLQHGEVVADAGAWSCAEGDVLPAVAARGVFRGEPFGVELQGAVPQGGVAMDRVDPYCAHGACLHE